MARSLEKTIQGRLIGLTLTVVLACLLVARVVAVAAAPPASASDTQAIFGLPFSGPPGPSTWYVVEVYGNTSFAYDQRNLQYEAGQGLHFGIDLGAKCGTPVLAVGDGVVSEVDGPHGAAPHNLMIDHPNGYASFYGHLLEPPQLVPGQAVRRGQVVARSGEPDGICQGDPHLHLEIRDKEHLRAFNPIPLITADWDNLAPTELDWHTRPLSGAGFLFEKDLDQPRRWQSLTDQPEIQFGGPMLNDYLNPWPPTHPPQP